MRVFHTIDDVRGEIRDAVVTVGSFDGVHAGHRYILDHLRQIARETGGESVVVTFEPHPRKILRPEDDSLKLLNSLEEKTLLLEQIGIDNLFVVNFTEEFSRLSSEEFARQYLLDGIGAKHIVMGYNHQFGHNREGNRSYLEGLKASHDFEVHQLPKHEVGPNKVSSTVIRFLVKDGELETARELLGEPYFFIAENGACGMLEYREHAKLFPPEGAYPVVVDDGEEPFETNLFILKGKLGLPIPAKSNCKPGQKVIVRFKYPARSPETY